MVNIKHPADKSNYNAPAINSQVYLTDSFLPVKKRGDENSDSLLDFKSWSNADQDASLAYGPNVPGPNGLARKLPLHGPAPNSMTDPTGSSQGWA